LGGGSAWQLREARARGGPTFCLDAAGVTVSNGLVRRVGYRVYMLSNEREDAVREWIVVCVQCLRIKRDGNWTNERAEDVVGKSSGFCDRCAKEQRKRESNER
jgi:hypothetical protein